MRTRFFLVLRVFFPRERVCFFALARVGLRGRFTRFVFGVLLLPTLLLLVFVVFAVDCASPSDVPSCVVGRFLSSVGAGDRVVTVPGVPADSLSTCAFC